MRFDLNTLMVNAAVSGELKRLSVVPTQDGRYQASLDYTGNGTCRVHVSNCPALALAWVLTGQDLTRLKYEPITPALEPAKGDPKPGDTEDRIQGLLL
jgi:hypothetical protein